MKSKNLFFALLIIFLIGASNIEGSIFSKKSANEFEVDSLLLKVAINEKGTAANTVKIKSLVLERLHVSLKLNGLEMASLSEDEIYLNDGEEKGISVNFNSENSKPGVYLGNLEIYTANEKKKIPIILEIQSGEVLFDTSINLFPQGDVVLGEKINAEIKIFDLANVGRSKVKANYFIKDFEGRTILSESEDLVVENKLDYSKTLDATKNLKIGNYVFIATIEYKDSIGTSSLFFSVVEKKQELYSGISMMWMIFLIVGLFVLFSFVFIYLLFYRDRALIELKSQYEKEVKKQEKIIKIKERKDYSKLKTAFEKKEYKKQAEKIKRQRMNYIREMHKKRLREYRKMKKAGDKEKLKKEVEKWKLQGYETSILENKFKFPKASEIKEKIKTWKSQGYDTRALGVHKF